MILHQAQTSHRDRPHPSPGLLVAVGALLLTLTSLVAPGAAPAPQDAEYKIKSAFLYNFAKYTQWPATAFPRQGTPLVLAVVQHQKFAKAVSASLSSKSVRNRKIIVRTYDEVRNLELPHILFVGSLNAADWRQVVRKCEGRPVLIVGDAPEIVRTGGMIRFYIDRKKVRFEVNPKVAQEAGLQISSQLLKLAKIVKE
jgi:hypothetical protein